MGKQTRLQAEGFKRVDLPKPTKGEVFVTVFANYMSLIDYFLTFAVKVSAFILILRLLSVWR